MNIQSIEHEHHIFTTFAKDSTPADNTVVLSLVVGKHFIHSYHFRYYPEGWGMNAIFLILITYSRHNTSFLKTCTSVDIIGATQDYLTVSFVLRSPRIFTHSET